MTTFADAKSAVQPARSRDEVIARLRRNEQEMRSLLATALYLFGSAARDQLSPDSDVDVFIDYDPEGPFSFVELVRGGEYLQEILGRKVDFATRDGLHPLLKDEIEGSSIRVF